MLLHVSSQEGGRIIYYITHVKLRQIRERFEDSGLEDWNDMVISQGNLDSHQELEEARKTVP